MSSYNDTGNSVPVYGKIANDRDPQSKGKDLRGFPCCFVVPRPRFPGVFKRKMVSSAFLPLGNTGESSESLKYIRFSLTTALFKAFLVAKMAKMEGVGCIERRAVLGVARIFPEMKA